MMKRLIPLLVLCAIALSSVQAFAAKLQLVPMRTSLAAVHGGGISDSTVISNTGTAGTYVADTTAIIVTANIRRPARTASAVAADSSVWFNWYFIPKPNSSVTVSGDSVYVQQLVSMDGSNWQAVTPGSVFYPDNQLPTSALYDGPASVHLEMGSSNNFYGAVKTALYNAGPAVGATTAPTHLQLAPYPYTKFVVIGDWGGEYQFYVQPTENDQ